MSLENQIRIFRWVSVLEGISFLVLLFLAMPLKYFFDLPQMVRVIGMAHGLLFILYVIGAFLMYKPLNWQRQTLIIALVCSVVPFGPFYIEKKYL